MKDTQWLPHIAAAAALAVFVALGLACASAESLAAKEQAEPPPAKAQQQQAEPPQAQQQQQAAPPQAQQQQQQAEPPQAPAPEPVPGSSFNAKIRWLSMNAKSGGNYLIEIDGDQTVEPVSLYYEGKNNITLTIAGAGTLSLASNGSLFTIGQGVTLVQEDNVVLKGKGWNVVRVGSGGTFTMNSGEIGNTPPSANSSGGSGVYVAVGEGYVSGGRFTMNGGKISGNSGGGVFVAPPPRGSWGHHEGGTFTMNGGEISGNSASSYDVHKSGGIMSGPSVTSVSGGAGGVFVGGEGTFTMSGGVISGNTASAAVRAYDGSIYDEVPPPPRASGGVYVVAKGTFTMSGGEISGNFASASTSGYSSYSDQSPYASGGVFVGGEGTFAMSGGKISGNSASAATDRSHNASASGGVYVFQATFTMKGGEISGNFASASNSVTSPSRRSAGGFRDYITIFPASSSGGVYVFGSEYSRATFTMNDGEISGNTARTNGGGGVYVASAEPVEGGGTFTMSGGEISGNTARTNGGGVYVSVGTFTKTGGTITGRTSDAANGNVVKNEAGEVLNNRGHAVYVPGTAANMRKREETAGPGVNLSANLGNNPPAFSGEWDWDY